MIRFASAGSCTPGNSMRIRCLPCLCVTASVMPSSSIRPRNVVKLCAITCLSNSLRLCSSKCKNAVVKLLLVDLVCTRPLNCACNVATKPARLFSPLGKTCSSMPPFTSLARMPRTFSLRSTNLVC